MINKTFWDFSLTVSFWFKMFEIPIWLLITAILMNIWSPDISFPSISSNLESWLKSVRAVFKCKSLNVLHLMHWAVHVLFMTNSFNKFNIKIIQSLIVRRFSSDKLILSYWNEQIEFVSWQCNCWCVFFRTSNLIFEIFLFIKFIISIILFI